MEDKEFVEYRGQRMIKGWPERIQAAQAERTFKIEGVEHQRIPYGREDSDWGADSKPCHDCRVLKDEFHVPGCDGEQCPVCKGQAISCECLHDSQIQEYLEEHDPE